MGGPGDVDGGGYGGGHGDGHGGGYSDGFMGSVMLKVRMVCVQLRAYIVEIVCLYGCTYYFFESK